MPAARLEFARVLHVALHFASADPARCKEHGMQRPSTVCQLDSIIHGLTAPIDRARRASPRPAAPRRAPPRPAAPRRAPPRPAAPSCSPHPPHPPNPTHPQHPEPEPKPRT